MPTLTGPLSRYPRIASRKLDEVAAFVHTGRLSFDVNPRDTGTIDFVSRGAFLPDSRIGYVRYGPKCTLWFPADVEPPDDFWVLFPLRGASELGAGNNRFECSPTRAAVHASGLMHRSGEDSERVTYAVSRAAVMRQLEALLGDQAVRKLEFMPTLDLESAPGRRLRRRVELAMTDLDEAGPERINPVMLTMYEQLIVSELLLGQPNSYTAALQGLENKVAPGDVKRAIDFIEAHLHEPLTLSDIARASGAPGRTLLEHFKHHRGVSPMRYLRNARLAKVRHALLHADGPESVTQIALEWGFSHLGRFAVEYRAQFGESPSQTLRRSRAARPSALVAAR